MRKLLPLLIILFAVAISYSEDITIRYWNDADKAFYFNREGFPYTWQFQRFDITQPCKIKSMGVYLFGQASKVTVCLIGHQGGSNLPMVFAYAGKNILATGQFQFDGAKSPTLINLPLQTPVDFVGDQVYVGVMIENADSTYFATTTETLQPGCDSDDGGKFGFQSIADFKAASANEMWRIAGYSYFCNITLEYTGQQNGYFSDRTISSGISPSLNPSTIAWGDINKDGFLDMLVAGRLYQNTGKGDFKDISTKAGISGAPQGNAFLDIDNDKDLDILFLNQTPSKSRIFLNDGSGVFTGSDLAIPYLQNVSGFAIADADNDNYPDIFITQSWSTYPNPIPNYFLQNNKKNNFTQKTGLCTTTSPRRSRGCAFVDYDSDGDLDLFVSNYYQEPDEIYENKGGLTFADVSGPKNIDKFNKDGKDYSNYGSGVDWYDFDNDGDMDLLLPQLAHPLNLAFGFQGTTIYRNNNGNFTNTWDATEMKSKQGIEYEEAHSGGAWGDIDNDGLVDLILTTYYGCRYIDLYKHNYDHTFTNITFDWGLNRIVTGDDACWVDYDNDGRLDLAMSQDRKFKLFKNTNNFGRSWVEIDLTSEVGNFFAIGARVKVQAGDRIYMQEVTSGRGQNMQKPSRLHFGLGDATRIENVSVRWPGTKEYIDYPNIKINQLNSIFNKSVSVDELEPIAEVDYLKIIGPSPAVSHLDAEFGIAKSNSTIQISLFDLNGNLIEELVNDNYSAGAYKLGINTDKYPAGTYFLRLFNGSKSEIKSFVIIK
jgi:hypothetical protein